MTALTYAVVTPARNEEANLPRLADSLAAQHLRPTEWVIVDDGSTDGTAAAARGAAARHPWIRLVSLDRPDRTLRGAPVVRAFHAGLAALSGTYDVVVKLDADVSLPAAYFATLIARFATDTTLGIASGTCVEATPHGRWVARFGTGDTVWGATRAYRRAVLEHVLPLEEEMGWDGIDTLKARLAGWRTATFTDVEFRHHRLEGARDGSRWRAWSAQGRASHYMGYRAWYLVARSVFNAAREPQALGMIAGYGAAAVRRRPRCGDASVRAALRQEQNLRALPARLRQALGTR